MANPTIGATTPRIQYTATASQTVFTVPFEFLANADLAVYVNGTLKALTTDYTLTGANTTGGGTLTFVTGRTAGDIVTILGDLDYSRNTNKYTKYGLLPAEVLEADFDALQVQAKQLARDGQFAIRAPLTDTGSPAMTLPVKTTRASKVLGFDASGNPAISASSITQMDAAVSVINTIAASTSGNAGSVVYTPAGFGAVPTTVQTKLREFISVKDFGAVGNGVANDTAAIQAAINAAIYNNSSSSANGLKAVVYLPAGIYLCSGPLHLGYGTSFTSVTLQGDGIRYNAEAAFNGTAIVFTHNNAPGIVVQGSRFPVIKDMTIKGANAAYITANSRGTGAGTDADLVAQNWVDPAFPASSSSRYAPYAGIAIDPYSGTRPATSYPDVAYPSFLGSVSQYGKNFSSSVSIENVQIDGFVVGVAVQPSDADGNGDYTKLNKVAITKCEYGLSIGNTQSRLVHLTDCQLVQVHTGIVTTKNGRQAGKPAILVESTEFGAIINWVDIPNLSFGGCPEFVSCYGELIYSIGTVTGASAPSAVKFDNCEFAFQLQDYRGVPKYIFSNSGLGFSIFSGCTFASSPSSNYAFFSSAGAKAYAFEGCTTLVGATNLYEKFSLNVTSGITVNTLGSDFERFSVLPQGQWNLDTGAVVNVESVGVANNGPRLKCLPMATKTILNNNIAEGQTRLPFYITGKSAFTFSTSGRNVTVTTNLSGNIWAMIQRGMGVGDTVWDDQTGITFRIRSRTAEVFIMEAVSGYDSAGNLLSSITNTGALYLRNCRIYSPSFPVYCDTTNGNAVAINVNRGDNTAAFIDTEIAVNDYIFFQPYGDKIGSENGLQITARDGTARTITVNGTFNRTATFRQVQLFIRAEAPNA